MKAREAAAVVLNEVTINGAYSNIAVAKVLRRDDLPEKDRRLFVELSYGSIKAIGTLDWMIAHYANDMQKIEPKILNILRVGFYQLFFLDRVPASAACNEAVNLAKIHSNSGAVKFVNAVMRAAVRQPGKIVYPDRITNPEKYLALRHFHPQWLTERWMKQFGLEATEQICLFDNEAPMLSVRVNTIKTDVNTVVRQLENKGCKLERSKWSPQGLRITKFERLDELSELQSGEIVVQDESSQLVAHVLGPQPGELVIDCCAAPGGKTTHIAALMKNEGRVIACDVFQHKIDILSANAKISGATIVEPVICDAREVGERWHRQADRVLADVPCSGLGILRKKADLRWKKQPQQFAGLMEIQGQILASAAEAVRVGGEIVYSTCTTEVGENEAIIEQFLSSHSDFELLDAGQRMPCVKKNEKMINMRPFSDQTDGFFVALLRRRQ